MHIVISAVSSARQPSGICRHAANLAICLSGEPTISRVTMLVGRWQSQYFQDAFGLGSTRVKIVDVDTKNNAGARNRWYYRKLPELAQQHQADVVHLTFPAPVSRRSFPCPVVSSLHDLYPYDSPGNFGYARVLFNRLFLRQCLNASDAVVCSSDFTLNRLRQRITPMAGRKVTRIYQIVTLNPDTALAPQDNNSAGSPFLLAVAQHRRNKNLTLLLTAFAELRQREPSKARLRLVIVGAEGPETAGLHALTQQLSLQNQVEFRSALSDGELCWFYQRCELMVVPSSVEGFCLPVIEALRCGSRVLCSDIPVLREIGAPHCRYFSLEQERPASVLARSIGEALREPRGRRFTSERFIAKEITRQYVGLYSRLLNDGARSPAAISSFAQYDRYAG